MEAPAQKRVHFMGRRIVKLLNAVTRIRRSQCDPDRLLILLPNCLQCSECEINLSGDVQSCERCGSCHTKEVLDLADKYGCQVAVATGGRLALKLAKDDSVDAVIAVACEKELQEGLKGIFPKPALGIINIRPHGPCIDTEVDVEELEKAIQWFVK